MSRIEVRTNQWRPEISGDADLFGHFVAARAVPSFQE
jgi:hypothetical protein